MLRGRLFLRFLRGGFRQLHVVEGILRVVEDHLHLGKRILQPGQAGRQVGGQRGDLLAGIHVAGARILAETGKLRIDAPGAHSGVALGLLGAAVGGQLLFGERRLLRRFFRLLCFLRFLRQLRGRFFRLRRGARQQLLPGRFGAFQLFGQLGALLRERVYLLGKRAVICLRLLQPLLQTGQLDLQTGVFGGELVALVGQLAQGLLVLNGSRFDIIDDVGAVKAADRRAEL